LDALKRVSRSRKSLVWAGGEGEFESECEREGEGEDEGWWFCRLQVGQKTEQSFGERRGKDRAVLQCWQGTLISSCRVRFSCSGYCAQV